MNQRQNEENAIKDVITAEELNDYLSSSDVFFDPSDGDEVNILGIDMVYREEYDDHSIDVKAYLYGENTTFTRDGVKEISYGNWTTTQWLGEWTSY